MKNILMPKVVLTAILLFWITACHTPSEPVGVKTTDQITIDTGGFCRGLAVNDSLIVAAADENGYRTYRYQLSNNSISYELINGVNDIDSDGVIDRLWKIALSDKINGQDYPLFFAMDYGDAVFYQNVGAPSAFNARVPVDGSVNREKVRSITIDSSPSNGLILYVLKESDVTNTNYISIRNLEIQYDFFDSTIVFWGASFERYDNLNIDSQDIFYQDSMVYVANSQLGIQEYQQMNDGSLMFKSEFDNIPGEVTVISVDNGLIAAGLTDDKGCYLALLDSNGQPTANLRIADGYTVRGIDIYQNILALACGNDGILLYDIRWFGSTIKADGMGFIDTDYAYDVKLVNDYCVFAGTRTGIQVSFIEY